MSSRAATRTRPEPARAGAQGRAALIVFARAPEPGRVKSRLVPLLGEAGAARLHARLAQRTLRTALAAEFAGVELHGAPGIGSEFFTRMRERFGVPLRAQGRGDLGDRMYRAFRRALRRHPCAVLIGTDCPALRPADLRAAARALLAGADAVLAPAEDGGYPLIGLRRVSRRLFDGIAWGGPQVLAQTRRRLAALGWRWLELRTLWDVDRPADVARLRRTKLPRLPPISAAVRRRARPSGGSPSRSGGPGRPSARRS